MEDVYNFETYIKFIKKQPKYNDIFAIYEVKNQEIDDYFDITCVGYPTTMYFKKEQTPKSICTLISLDMNGKKGVLLEEVIKRAAESIQTDKVKFIGSLLNFIKLNVQLHVFQLSRQQKKLPNPTYRFKPDTDFSEKVESYLKSLNTFEPQPQTPLAYFYFLETPATVYSYKIIKICVSDKKIDNAISLVPYTFEYNVLGHVAVPNKFNLRLSDNDEFEEMLQNLLPKHVIFVAKNKTDKVNIDDIEGGFYKYSPHFQEAFKQILKLISTTNQ